jgi:hypothetical protein
MKYTRFRDIPQFTRCGNYQVNVDWGYLERHLTGWHEPTAGSPLVLDPDFQRGHVWTEEKQIHYVEYILRGGRSSRVLYFNCSTWNKGFNTPVELVDGKQRLEAVRRFLRNELVVFGASRFSDFTEPLRCASADFVLQMNDLPTRAQVLQWYLDLNTGGVVHTEEEIDKVKELLKKENS